MKNRLWHFVLQGALPLLTALWMCPISAAGQDSTEQDTNSRGSRAELTVTVRERSGEVVTVPTAVKLFRNGALEDQKSTSQGHAFFIPRSLGEFTITVEAVGYRAAQKDVSLAVAIPYADEVVLERDMAASSVGIPGTPLLAPRAKEALDKGELALKDGRLEEAQRHISEAVKLAPGNPDVLYVQGMLYMKQSNWEQAQIVLEKANQLAPNQPHLLSALGMNLCNQKKYEQAIPPLEKSIHLEPSLGWETEWALAKAYYYQHAYDRALNMAEQAHARSHGSAAQVELLFAQCLTAAGRFEDSAQVLREFLKNTPEGPDAATAHRWLSRLAADSKIRQ